MSTELLGAAQKLLDVYGNTDNATALTAAGLNVTNLTTALTTPRNNYSVAEQMQEALKTQLTSATVFEQAQGQTHYDMISDQVDAAAGSVGKKTALGKQILAVREQLNKAKSGSSGGTGSRSSDSGSGSGSSSDSGSGSGSGSGSASS